MTKNHYLAFAVYVYDDRMWFQRFYPEQSASFRMPVMRKKGDLYCVKHGSIPSRRFRCVDFSYLVIDIHSVRYMELLCKIVSRPGSFRQSHPDRVFPETWYSVP